MAEVKVKVEVLARSEMRTTHLICDLCGAQSPSAGNWASGGYDFDEITVERSRGARYPDSGSRETAKVDLCPECFQHKLLPWLREQGCAVSEESVDW